MVGDPESRKALTRMRLSVGALTLTLLLTVGLLTPTARPRERRRRHRRRVGRDDRVGHGPLRRLLHAGARLREAVRRRSRGDAYEQLEGVFGLRLRVVRLRLGDEILELTQYLAPRGGRPIPVDSHSNDHWFQHIAIIVRDMDEAYARLRETRSRLPRLARRPSRTGTWARPASEPSTSTIRTITTWKCSRSHMTKGWPKWQAKDRLFLGIDHTAIVVGDTEASLQFYRDTLGLKIAGTARTTAPSRST